MQKQKYHNSRLIESMDDGKKSIANLAQTPKYSVRNRVLAGLTIIVLAFSTLIAYSILLYRQTVAEMSLINTTYLPLTLGTSEIRSTQVVFNTLMDRLTDDPNQTITRDWLIAARRYRPATLKKMIRLINKTLEKDLPKDEIQFLRETRRRLSDVKRRYRLNENKFARLFTDLDMGHNDDLLTKIEKLKRSERLLNSVLSGIGSDVKLHITEVSNMAIHDGIRATWALAIMSITALLIGFAIVFSTHKLLSPLKKLQTAVSRVAGGDLGTKIEILRQNEIGVLASNFNLMTNALAQRNKMLIRSEQLATAGKIAAQVTHEIRNPLSSLGLNAELLEDELPVEATADEARTLLKAMQDEIERLTEITESYLRFARLPAPNPKDNNLNQIITDSLEFMNSELVDKNIKTLTSLDSNIKNIFIDKGQIRQTLINLVQNAIDAMPNGGEISIKTKNTPNEAVLSISDIGPGIKTQNASQIFEAFYTTKASGTGLGLALVKQICIAHGGEITHKNIKNMGSEFTISLPKETHNKIESKK